jgi:adenylate cyclase
VFSILLVPERPWLVSVWIGITGGLMFATPIVLWFVFGLESAFGRRLKRLPLLLYLGVNAGLTAAMLLFGHFLAHGTVWPDRGGFWGDPYLPSSLAFSVAVVLVASVAIELRRLIGPGVFGAVLVGRYRHPRTERRVFLMLDIKGSTALAERLGSERFLEFLNRWIHALTEPLLASGAAVYRYVGDEVIATWEWSDDAATRAILFVEATRTLLAQEAASWQREFGAVPEMHAALPGGPVLIGEVGDVKREIAFLGDTLNTLARIAEETRRHEGTLASAEVLAGVRLPSGLTRRDLGAVALRGKAEPVALVLPEPSP